MSEIQENIEEDEETNTDKNIKVFDKNVRLLKFSNDQGC